MDYFSDHFAVDRRQPPSGSLRRVGDDHGAVRTNREHRKAVPGRRRWAGCRATTGRWPGPPARQHPNRVQSTCTDEPPETRRRERPSCIQCARATRRGRQLAAYGGSSAGPVRLRQPTGRRSVGERPPRKAAASEPGMRDRAVRLLVVFQDHDDHPSHGAERPFNVATGATPGNGPDVEPRAWNSVSWTSR